MKRKNRNGLCKRNPEPVGVRNNGCALRDAYVGEPFAFDLLARAWKRRVVTGYTKDVGYAHLDRIAEVHLAAMALIRW